MQTQTDGRTVADIGTAVYRFFPDGKLDRSFSRLQVGDEIHSIAVDASDRIYVGDDGGLVQQFSGRLRIRVSQADVPLVLERSSVIDSGWTTVQSIPAATSYDLIPNFPGIGNTFYRARPAQ